MDANNELSTSNPESVARRIFQNKKAFISYNILRLRELIRYLSPKKMELFHAIPVLLHINSPDLPGHIDDPLDSYGIYRFHDSGFWKLVLKHLKFNEKEVRPYLSNKYFIRGLYLMGSTGTLAQSKYSDFDYWVVVDNAKSGTEQLSRLYQRLAKIERWAKEAYNQHVTFFVLEYQEIRNNNFSAIDEESSGTAQRTLLKEEFYRTFIMIAGQIPYWAVLPAGLDDNGYNDWINLASKATNINFIEEDYIDLGNLTAVHNSESLGAILWQVYKARNDPIKSLIKASLVVYFHFYQDKEGLLCDAIKRRFPQRQLDSYLIDPYAIIFQKIVNFYSDIDDKEGLDLAKECIFLRIYQNTLASEHESDTPKEKLLKHFINEWAWDEEKINRLESYKKWPEYEKLAFDKKIFRKISLLYELIMRGQDKAGPVVDMTASDLKTLKNRIESCFRKKEGKLPRASTYLRTKVDLYSVLLTCERDVFGNNRWLVYDQTAVGAKKNERILFEGPELLRVMGWVVMNEIYKGNMTLIMFQPNQYPVTTEGAKRLLNEVHRFLPNETPSPDQMDSDPVWEKMLVTLDAGSFSRGRSLDSADFLVRNTWGELYFGSIHLGDTENNLLKCHKIAKNIWNYLYDFTHSRLQYHVCRVGVGPDNIASTTIEEFIGKFRRRVAGRPTADGRREENFEQIHDTSGN
jgi:adenylate cyclase class 1